MSRGSYAIDGGPSLEQAGVSARQAVLNVVTPDYFHLAAVVVVIGLASLAACYIPGRRAVRVDPIVALRAD